jgi:two-component system sensor histidine kinase KdpD
LARALAASPDRSDALVAGVQLIREMFQAESAIYLPGENGLEPQPVSTFMPNEKEESVAAWAFQKKQPAGLTTDTLPESSALHLPLVAADRAEGVLAVRLRGPLSLEQRELLDGFVAQLALFLHKERALHENRAAQLAAQSQKFQKTLFDCVSHELKTPLAAISAILQQPSPDRAELLQATRRLTNTVENLLDATRLESGLLQPVREWCDPGEILREAMQQVAFENHPLQLSIADSLPHVSIDARLMIQALTAILTNATIYSPPNEPIEAAVHVDGRSIVFTVADHGAGLQQGEEGKVFEKFYRGAGKPPGGLGLGLSIARRLVEAHGGVITAQNRPGGGARFTIRLPIDKPMQLPPEAAA